MDKRIELRNSNRIDTHEDYLHKIGTFNSNIDNMIVTSVIQSDGENAIFVDSDKTEKRLTSGTVIGANVLVKTLNSRVEIISKGTRFRLDKGSIFRIENTAVGFAPVVYGNVHIKTIDKEYYCEKKYLTSCWWKHEEVIIEEEEIKKSDIYYSLEEPVDIYEFDERGIKFHIMHLEPFQTAMLSYDFNKCMRERYHVIFIRNSSDEEIRRNNEKYILPFHWR